MYKSSKIAKRIKVLAKKNDVLVKELLEKCGLNKNALSTMQSGNSIPRADKVAKIADELGCSVDYLLGRTNNPKINH